MTDVIGVVGAGTMGVGIAQVAAVAGHPVIIFDAVPGAAQRAVAILEKRITDLVAKGKLDRLSASLDLTAAANLAALAPARTVVEAVVEDLAVKRKLFKELEGVVASDCVLATNTSTLTPTSIAAELEHGHRVLGVHFFNPAPVMKLVEIVPGRYTDPDVVLRVGDLITSWGKSIVRSAETPGFIVNRVARPFYGEPLRVLEEGGADPQTIDAIVVGGGGFRMGPFSLMDLIGNDVNAAVTDQTWRAFSNDPRFAPSMLQGAMVEGGLLGRKSGRGFYNYAPGTPPPIASPAPPARAPSRVTVHGAATDLLILLDRAGVDVSRGNDHGSSAVQLPSGAMLVRCNAEMATVAAHRIGSPVVVVDRAMDDATADAIAIAGSDGISEEAMAEAIGLLQAAGLAVYPIDDVPGLVVTRLVAMLVNLAVDALHLGVARADDIDLAMQLGTNYPIGPIDWGRRWGARTVVTILDNLQSSYGDPRYRSSVLLRRWAASDG